LSNHGYFSKRKPLFETSGDNIIISSRFLAYEQSFLTTLTLATGIAAAKRTERSSSVAPNKIHGTEGSTGKVS